MSKKNDLKNRLLQKTETVRQAEFTLVHPDEGEVTVTIRACTKTKELTEVSRDALKAVEDKKAHAPMFRDVDEADIFSAFYAQRFIVDPPITLEEALELTKIYGPQMENLYHAICGLSGIVAPQVVQEEYRLKKSPFRANGDAPVPDVLEPSAG